MHVAVWQINIIYCYLTTKWKSVGSISSGQKHTLIPGTSAVSLTRSTDTERLFSNILTLLSTDWGFMAGSSSSSSLGGGGNCLEAAG